MLRILHVIGAMDRGGAETMIMNLYRSIDRSQVLFDFLVHEQRECDYDKEIEELGGRIYRLPRFNAVNYFAYRRLCRRFFAEHPGYKIVHGHIGSSAAIYLAEAKRAGAVAIAHSHAQNYQGGIAGWGFNVVSHPTRNIADWFFACSYEAGRDRFGEKVVNGDRIAILNNGVDLDLYRCDEEQHEEAKRVLGLEGKTVIGHVGRLIPVKNHRYLFEVFSQVKCSAPNVILLLAGRGELEGSLKRMAADMGISDSVKFLGIRDDVPALLRAFDVFLFPSKKEGLPLAAVEAQASGLPCLMSTGISKQALVSDRSQMIPLEDQREWVSAAVHLCRKAGEPRTDCVDQVRAHGFDIKDTAAKLQAFYLSWAEGNRVNFNEL